MTEELKKIISSLADKPNAQTILRLLEYIDERLIDRDELRVKIAEYQHHSDEIHCSCLNTLAKYFNLLTPKE